MEKFSHRSSKPGKFVRASFKRPSESNAIQIIMTLSATTVKAKRSFSRIGRVKTWLRSAAIASDRLSDLCVLYSHQERVDEKKANRILATMAGEKRRRMDF